MSCSDGAAIFMTWTPPTIILSAREKAEAQRIKALLTECNYDLDLWCSKLGYELRIVHEAMFTAPVVASMRGKKLYVVRTLLKEQMIEAIAHEHCHATFHAECVSYEELHEFTAGHDEGHAIAFEREVLG